MPSTPQKRSIAAPTLGYCDFGSCPTTRLNALRGLSVLMACSPALYSSAQALKVSAEEWKALRSWLLDKDAAGEALLFWRAEPHGVRVLRVCTGHILIGTSQLLRDLADPEVKAAPAQSQAKNVSAPRVPSLEEVWRAARHYVAAEVSI